jgi:hypothetical protein
LSPARSSESLVDVSVEPLRGTLAGLVCDADILKGVTSVAPFLLGDTHSILLQYY